MIESIQVKYTSRFSYLSKKLTDCRENCEVDIPEEYWCEDCKRILSKFNNISEKFRKSFLTQFQNVMSKLKESNPWI